MSHLAAPLLDTRLVASSSASSGWRTRIVVLSSLCALSLLSGVFLWDLALADYFHAHRGVAYRIAEVVSWAGQAGWYLVPSAGVWWMSRRLHWPLLRRLSAVLFLSVAASALVTDVLKVLFGRARPWVWFSDGFYGFHPMNFKAAFQSFPSGHATTAFAVAFALSVIFPKGRTVFLIGGTLVALSRVFVYAHFLSDVIAGALVAYVTVRVITHYQFADLRRASLIN